MVNDFLDESGETMQGGLDPVMGGLNVGFYLGLEIRVKSSSGQFLQANWRKRLRLNCALIRTTRSKRYFLNGHRTRPG